MATRLLGRKVTALTEDKDGHREYKVTFKVAVDDPSTESVINVYNCPDIPVPGNYYAINQELDLWAWCGREIHITEMIDEEPNKHFLVERTFSTKNSQRCVDTKVENPLFEPPKISWSYTKTKEEASDDIFGMPILNSAFEQIRGPQVEFETGNINIKIEQNVASFYLACVLPGFMKDCVNDRLLWGFPPRTVRLSGVTGERKYYGQCFPYYTRHLEFDTECTIKTGPNGQKIQSTWDRYILDEGHKVLSGAWENVPSPGTGIRWKLTNINGEVPDETNPAHFIQYRDASGQNVKVVLNGAGIPIGSSVGDPRRYAAIADVPDGNTTFLDDVEFWVPLTGGMEEWQDDTQYSIGDLVVVIDEGKQGEAKVFVAVVAPDMGIEPEDDAAWIRLPNGTTDRGIWQIGLAFDRGDVVLNPNFSQKTAPGQIFVAKYPYADFSQLGIPLQI